MRRRLFLILGLVIVLGLAVAAVGCGGSEEATTEEAAAPTTTEASTETAAPAETGAPADTAAAAGADEFGETYEADPAVLEKALFDPSLLPAEEAGQQVALAAFARASTPVDLDLALECWRNNGCDTGTGGELTAAYLEPFGENRFREIAKMEFILQALTYPEIGEIIYTSSKAFTSTPSDPLADFRAAIAQGADVIVSFPDIGDQYLPVYREATEQGIPVSTYAWGYVTGPGENYTTVIGEDTCALGEAFAEVMNEQVGSGKIAFLGGTPGNPLSKSWQDCEEKALNPEIEVVGRFDTNWQAAGVQEVMASLLASHPDLKGISYEYATGMAQGAFPAFEAAGVTPDQVWTLRTDEVDLGCAADELGNPNLKIFYYTGGTWQIRQALTAGMMKLQGFEVPPTIVFPIVLQEQSARDLCVEGYPSDVPSSTLVPPELLSQMYPDS